ncbi:MAG: c-type cytochrome biogenesis protein CcmI [Rhodoferax sp.]|nr:c-type cytochrome biogenesis protein CcmI [Rhodoferax sp.]
MNAFIAIAVLMTLLVIAWLAYALLGTQTSNGVSSERLNAEIHRDQLKALENDLTRGVISQQDFETTRDELQLRLLDDTQSFEAATSAGHGSLWTPKRTSIAIAVTMPFLAMAFYWQLGAPGAINPVAANRFEDPQVKQMVETLEAKLKANPNNPQGWAMLARSYKVMGRMDEAERTFMKVGNAINTDADLMVELADLLAVKANNNIEGKPLELVNKALQINSKHPMGLMMSGVAAFRRSDFKMAIGEWEKLLAVLEPGSPDAQQVQANIDDARTQAGIPVTGAATDSTKLPPVSAQAAANVGPDMVNQMVDRLAARLKDSPNDTAGWAQLAHAYKVQGRLQDASQAYAKTGKLLDTDVEVILQYADVLAMMANNSLSGKPLELIQKALKIDPKNAMALMLAGQASYKAANYQQAIGYWERVLAVLPVNSPDVPQVQAEITDAKAKIAK